MPDCALCRSRASENVGVCVSGARKREIRDPPDRKRIVRVSHPLPVGIFARVARTAGRGVATARQP